MYNIPDYETIRQIMIFSLIILVILIVLIWSVRTLYKLTESAQEFYAEAKEIEEIIFEGTADQNDVERQIRELDKKGWHRTHGDKIQELAKLFHLKYGKNIIRK